MHGEDDQGHNPRALEETRTTDNDRVVLELAANARDAIKIRRVRFFCWRRNIRVAADKPDKLENLEDTENSEYSKDFHNAYQPCIRRIVGGVLAVCDAFLASRQNPAIKCTRTQRLNARIDE